MKQLFIMVAIFAMSCGRASVSEKKIITSEQKLPTGQYLYTVNCAKPYTFIEWPGHYVIGQEIK